MITLCHCSNFKFSSIVKTGSKVKSSVAPIIMSSVSSSGIQYISYAKDIEDNILQQLIVTDCTHPGAVTLTHHKGDNNPQNVSPSDSSTGWALNAIQSNNNFVTQKIRYATCNHFDVDGVLSIWVVLNQQEALKWEQVLRHAARVGDFREAALAVDDYATIPEFQQDGVTSKEQVDLGLKLCCWLNTQEKLYFSAPYEDLSGDDDEKFAYFLPKIGPFLSAPDDYRQEWETEYQEVLNGWKEYMSGLVKVDKFEEISLAIVYAPKQYHYYALFSFTVGYDYVLTVYPGNKYELESKYTQFVNLHSRPTLPRLNLVPLAKKLNSLESAQIKTEQNLKWDVSRFIDSGPLLRMDDQGRMLSKQERYGNPYDRSVFSSSISQDDMVHIVVSYLRFGSEGQTKKIGDWTWQDLQQINKQIEWDQWGC
eukprot:TRINITY_DN5727_c1_g1_i1.p1 TRINITY_DN5727_c1_g1~~TRINITY_DN5727_c1_g1_i1.p1  ORF type:complete len:423 (+),score=73.92 TRINITY_DN5727_c1_g1_i1:42-1310(+)